MKLTKKAIREAILFELSDKEFRKALLEMPMDEWGELENLAKVAGLSIEKYLKQRRQPERPAPLPPQPAGPPLRPYRWVKCHITGRKWQPGQKGWWGIRSDGQWACEPFLNVQKYREWTVVYPAEAAAELFLRWASAVE